MHVRLHLNMKNKELLLLLYSFCHSSVGATDPKQEGTAVRARNHYKPYNNNNIGALLPSL